MTPRTNSLYWYESSDETKLQLEVTEKDGRYFLSNTAEYHPTNLNVFYFVDWDLLGEQIFHEAVYRCGEIGGGKCR